MFRQRAILVVSIVLTASLLALGVVGRQVLERDRDAMYARYAQDRAVDVGESARAFLRDLDDIGEDLELAAALVAHAESPQVAERELHASATIKREYLAMAMRAADGSVLRVVAADAVAGTDQLVGAGLEHMLAEAERTPGRLRISAPLGRDGTPASWYRVYARKPAADGAAVAVVVDLSIAFAHSPIQPSADSRFLVASASGDVLVKSTLTRTQVDASPALERILATLALYEQPTTATVSARFARAIGLAPNPAAAIGIPLRVDEGRPWHLLVVTATSALEAQEHTLVRRVLVGGALVLVLLLSSAAYIIANARRTAILQERLVHVDRLAHLTEKAEKIVANIPSGVITLSASGRITSANRWFVDRGVAEVTGQELGDAFRAAPTDQLAALEALVAEARRVAAIRTVERMRFELLGREAMFRIQAVPLEHGIADVTMLLVFEDLTQQLRFEERLLLSEKLATAGQLAAGIAHEIGTPLNVARGRVELVASHLGADHAEAGNHKIVVEQIDRVTRLIQQLLDYVRPAVPATQLVDVAATIRTVAELLAPQVAKRGVQLRSEVADTLPAVRVDPDHLQQIMINLVINALDACERGGKVVIGASLGDDQLRFEVRDDGHGIPRELQAQVFDPFFTTKKRGQGTGLGLWVVAQLVRAHGGEISLTSEPEQGTTMRVSWPVSA